MGLYLRIISLGTAEGRQFRIVPKMELGRSQGSIIIDDPKMSSRHAMVEQESDGLFKLVDLNSFNGILVSGHRVKNLILTKGTRFQLGKTKFEVVDLSIQEEVDSEKQNISHLPWEQKFPKVIEQIKEFKPSQKMHVLPFAPVLTLRFIKGPQAAKSITLGYGPRSAGLNSLDIELQEPSSPAEAFLLVPTPQGPQFITTHPYRVLLNNAPQESALIHEGDQIKIGTTLIEIRNKPKDY